MLKDEPKQPVPTSFEDEQDLMAFLPDDEIPTEDEIAFTILRHIHHANPQLFDDETKPSNETCNRVSVSYKDLTLIRRIVELCNTYDIWSAGDLLDTVSEDDMRQIAREVGEQKALRRTRAVNQFNH